MSDLEKKFNITDSEGQFDFGLAECILERKSEMTAGNQKIFPQQRCALLKLEFEKIIISGGSVAYIVAVFHSDKELKDYMPGEWFDSKVMSGFGSLREAMEAYERYGPAYLIGERLIWSQFTCV